MQRKFIEKIGREILETLRNRSAYTRFFILGCKMRKDKKSASSNSKGIVQIFQA